MIHVIECSAWIPSGLCIYKQVVRFLAVHSIAPLFSMSANSKESFEENWLPKEKILDFFLSRYDQLLPPSERIPSAATSATGPMSSSL